MDADKISRLRITEKQEFTPGGPRRWKPVAALLLLVSALLLALGAYWQGLLSPSVTVRGTSVGWIYPSQVLTDFNASGYVVAQRKAAVASKGTGRLEYLGVREGSTVKEGQVLARLENDDLKAERDQIKAQLASARSDLVRAETELRTSELNYNRLKDLLQRRAISQLDFEIGQDRYLKARASLDSARAGIRALEAGLLRSEVLIEYTLIKAPFDGVVLTKDADVGEVVAPFGSATNAKAAVVTMADLSSLLVEADVAESFLSRVQMGQPCEVLLDALPETRFPGKVDTIVPTADRTRATVMVKVRFDRLDPRVLPEMSARVAFLSRPLLDRETQPFLGVHREAAVDRNGEKGLFLIEEGRARWLSLPDAEFFGDYLVSKPPLKEGQRVVLKPSRDIKSGDRVNISD